MMIRPVASVARRPEPRGPDVPTSFRPGDARQIGKSSSARIAALRAEIELGREPRGLEKGLRGTEKLIMKGAMPTLAAGALVFGGGLPFGLQNLGLPLLLAPVVAIPVLISCRAGADSLASRREHQTELARHELEALTVGTSLTPGADSPIGEGQHAVVVGGVQIKKATRP